MLILNWRINPIGYLPFIKTSHRDFCTELITYARFKKKSGACFILLKYYFDVLGVSIYSSKVCRTFLEILKLPEMTSLTHSIPNDI